MKLKSILAAAAIIAVVPAQAQLGANRPAQRPQPKNYAKELSTILADLGKKYEAKIVLDPSLPVPTVPRAPQGNALMPSLDGLVSNIPGAAWRRVYLNQAEANTMVPPEKLANSVRALEVLEQSGLVLENPATNRATSFVKNFSVPQNFTEALEAQQFSVKPVYVIFQSRLRPGGGVEDELIAMQQRSMELMMNMTPDQMQNYMTKTLDMFANMDPQVRQRFMGQMMQAGMQMFQNMSPDQRNQLLGGLLGGAGGGPVRRPPQ